jgi:hypothetical protein
MNKRMNERTIEWTNEYIGMVQVIVQKTADLTIKLIAVILFSDYQ